MNTLGLVLDGLMVVLLLFTLLSMRVLSSRLKYLRDSRQEFEGLIRQFDDASKRADSGIKGLQAAAGKAGEGLQQQLDRARALRDELSSMIESADSMAGRLEAARPATAQPAAPEKPAEAGRAVDPRSKAEMDLLRAMSGSRREGGS